MPRKGNTSEGNQPVRLLLISLIFWGKLLISNWTTLQMWLLKTKHMNKAWIFNADNGIPLHLMKTSLRSAIRYILARYTHHMDPEGNYRTFWPQREKRKHMNIKKFRILLSEKAEERIKHSILCSNILSGTHIGSRKHLVIWIRSLPIYLRYLWRWPPHMCQHPPICGVYSG